MSLIDIDLMTDTLKIPLWFLSSIVGPFFGTVVMFALFRNFGISFSLFRLLHKISKDALKSDPITSFLKISFKKPLPSLDFFRFKSFRANSQSLLVHNWRLF